MRIGIAGCGLNSDYHIKFSKAYAGSEIVGVADKDLSKAMECASKHGIKRYFSSVAELAAKAKPEVIHVLTPPRTHFSVAKEAIEAGCHVLIEKPMALNAREASALFGLAEGKGVKICAMHNHLFDPCMAKVDSLAKSGKMGEITGVESYYGLNTMIPALRDYPAPNTLPWLYELPGSVYQDFLPHPLYVLLEYTGRPLEIKVASRSNGVLPQSMADEVRVLVNGERSMGTLTLSFAARPHLHFVRIYGTKMMAEVDINTMTAVTHLPGSLPKAAEKAAYNLIGGWQLFSSTFSNVFKFLTGRLRPYQGMKALIHGFYDSIKNSTEPPVSREKALLVIEAMDEILRQLNPKPLSFEEVIPRADAYPKKHSGKVLVTGGTGFLGKRLVESLVAEGYPVRVLARKLSNIEDIRRLGAEIYFGDVAHEGSLEKALEGIDVVVHGAAGTSGKKKDCDTATILGTANVLKACEARGVRKLVYISSCSVYGTCVLKDGDIVTEDAPLERSPEKRGDYSSSKQSAELMVQEEMKKNRFPIVILRPGTIYGPGGEVFTPIVGFSAMKKAFIVIGSGKSVLPFVYVDNVADAVIRSIEKKEADNRIFNVVDGDGLTKRDYMERLVKRLYPRAPVFYLPFGALYWIVSLQEAVFGALKKRPFLTRYRLSSSQRRVTYDNSRIREALGWRPRVTFDKAASIIAEFEAKRG